MMNPADRKLAEMSHADLLAEAEKLRLKLQRMDYRGCYWDANIVQKLAALSSAPVAGKLDPATIEACARVAEERAAVTSNHAAYTIATAIRALSHASPVDEGEENHG